MRNSPATENKSYRTVQTAIIGYNEEKVMTWKSNVQLSRFLPAFTRTKKLRKGFKIKWNTNYAVASR
jgi:hypothetical protein